MRHTSFDRVELLPPSAKVETLFTVSWLVQKTRDMFCTNGVRNGSHTSESSAKGIRQLSGGMILTMPNFCASSRMLWMY